MKTKEKIIGEKPPTLEVNPDGTQIIITLSPLNALPMHGIMSAPENLRIAQLLTYLAAAVLVELEQASTPDGVERAAPGSPIIKAN